LNAAFIRNYLRSENQQCVIVLFSGSSDKEILYKLNIKDYSLLNILCYDTNNTKKFFVQLKNLRTHELICEIKLGYYETNGRQVNQTGNTQV